MVASQPAASAHVPQPAAARSAWLVLADSSTGGALQALAAATVRVVSTPAAFAAALQADRPRVAVLGCPPGGPADIDLLARERTRRPTLRAVLLDPPDRVEQRLRALELGFDEALRDDTDPWELTRRVALLLERRHISRDPAHLIIHDGLELDLAAHELRRDGEAVHLRPREFALLALLGRQPGRAYSRRELLQRVWGQGRTVDPRTVDVHVRWLREKLEPDPDHPIHLVTVRGLGYRLDPLS